MLPIYDNHIHMSPRGRGIDAIKDFKDAGGSGFTLVHMPYDDPISDGEDLLRSYHITIKQAQQARELGLKVNVAVGPYPILLISLTERFGLEKAERIMMDGMEHAVSLVSEGKANAIGEVGRPHFEVPDEIMEASQRILIHGMELAKDIDCPVIIHSEASPETMVWLRNVADTVSLDPAKVVKHLSPPFILESENHGIMPSVAASRSSIKEALSKGDRFMLETDYIDSLERPDVVMPVTTVPKRIKGLLQSNGMSEETLWKICEDIPSKLYDR